MDMSPSQRHWCLLLNPCPENRTYQPTLRTMKCLCSQVLGGCTCTYRCRTVGRIWLLALPVPPCCVESPIWTWNHTARRCESGELWRVSRGNSLTSTAWVGSDFWRRVYNGVLRESQAVPVPNQVAPPPTGLAVALDKAEQNTTPSASRPTRKRRASMCWWVHATTTTGQRHIGVSTELPYSTARSLATMPPAPQPRSGTPLLISRPARVACTAAMQKRPPR